MKMCVGKTVETVESPDLDINTISERRGSFIDQFPKSDQINRINRLVYSQDLLSIFTVYTKIILFAISDFYKSFQQSTYFKIIFHTTQPAHVITILSVSTIAFLMFPNQNQEVQLSPLLTLVYLGSFSAHFGAQIWMTFISGLSLYFSLPRHTFGSVQQVLFPKYFLLNAGLSLITLAIFLRHNNTELRTPQISVQVASMTLCFLIELIIRLYLAPPLLRLMVLKNEMEKEAGVGMEVGKHTAGDLIKCPYYLKVHNNFRKVHMTIAIGNLIAMGCTILHLHYLSQKLCVL